MMSFYLYAFAVLAALSVASFMVPDEGIRGMGRVLGGLSLIASAGFLYTLHGSLDLPEMFKLVCANVNLTGNGAQLPPVVQLACNSDTVIPSWVIGTLLVSGVAAIACGVRKYLRRPRGTDNNTPSK